MCAYEERGYTALFRWVAAEAQRLPPDAKQVMPGATLFSNYPKGWQVAQYTAPTVHFFNRWYSNGLPPRPTLPRVTPG